MHNNREYYNFLIDLPGGEDLYDRVDKVESLYIKGEYEAVSNAARMFFECFTDKICEYKNITPTYRDDYPNKVNYTKTLRDIFTKSEIKDEEWYKKNNIEDWYKDINEGSHYKGIDNIVAKDIQDNNSEILYTIRDICMWYYGRTAKKKINFDTYRLPDILGEANQEEYSLNAFENPYKEINESIQKRNIELCQKLNIANDRIVQLEKEYCTMQQHIQTISVKNQEFNEQCQELLCDIDKLTSKQIEDKKNESKIKKLIIKLKNTQKEYIEQEQKNKSILNLNLEKESEIKELKIELDKYKQITEQNKKLSSVQKFLDNIVESIRFMNKLGCYCKIMTLYRFLIGENSKQASCFPALKASNLWGIYRNAEQFNLRWLEKGINTLLKNKTILLNDAGDYILSKELEN